MLHTFPPVHKKTLLESIRTLRTGELYADTAPERENCYGYINSSGDVDWWKFDTDNPAYINITLKGLPTDYDIYLYDENDNRIWSSAEAGTSPEIGSMVYVPAGCKYVKIFSVSDKYNSQYSYRLQWELARVWAVPASNRITAIWNHPGYHREITTGLT